MKRLVLLLVLPLAVVVGAKSTFTLDETEQAVVTQFGAFVAAEREPGLHFKIPFVQAVHVFEKWILEWNGLGREIPTREKQLVFIDTYARWRIADPRRFYESVGSEEGAQGRLDDIIDAGTRDVVSRNNLIEMVRDSARPLALAAEEGGGGAGETSGGAVPIETPKLGRSEMEREILTASRSAVERLGIELLDVRIKRVKYEDSVQERVFERMNSERLQKAARLQSEGEGKAGEIEGQKDKELLRITSEAYLKEQQIKGAADAEATRIYADAYNQDPRFYAFVKTLETYREALKGDTTIVLSADSELFRLLKEPPAAARK